MSVGTTLDRTMARVTLQTIADKVGVSRMTVSNAFSRPDQLSEELRTKVLAAADELGYVGPDPSARALARGSTGAVGMLLTDSLSEAFADSVATDVPGLGRRRTRRVRPRPDPADAGRVRGQHPGPRRRHGRRARLHLRARQPRHRVAAQAPTADGRRRPDPRPRARRTSTSTTGPAPAPRPSTCSTSATGASTSSPSATATAACVVDPIPWRNANNFSAGQRMLGWLDALNPPASRRRVVLTPFRPAEAADEGARLLLDNPDRPTAVLCFSDVYAASVVHAAQAAASACPTTCRSWASTTTRSRPGSNRR